MNVQEFDFISPKQLEAEFGISISKQEKLRMRKNKKMTECMLCHFLE